MIASTFLCWGRRKAPAVFILTPQQADEYVAIQLRTVDAPDGFASMCMFGIGYEYAAPAVQQCMETLAFEYVGPHQQRIRYMAACLAIGRPIEPPADDDGDPAILISPQPTQPPSGDRVTPREALAVA